MEYQFLQIPKQLFSKDFKELPALAKLLYGLLLERHYLSCRNRWRDNSGNVYIYYPLETITEFLSISTGTAVKLMHGLEDAGLITREKQGAGRPDKIKVVTLTEHTANDKASIKKPKKTEPKKSNPKYDNMRTYDIRDVEDFFNQTLY